MLLSAPLPSVRVPARKIDALSSLITATLARHADRRRIDGLSIARIAGHLQSMRFAMPPVNLFTRALYAWLGGLPLSHVHMGPNYSARRPLPPAAELELCFWLTHLRAWNGVALQQAPFTRVLYTDASGTGWGGFSGCWRALRSQRTCWHRTPGNGWPLPIQSTLSFWASAMLF